MVSPLVSKGLWISTLIVLLHWLFVGSFVFYIVNLKWLPTLEVSFIFQLHGECHCWRASEYPRALVAKFYGRLRLIHSVLMRENFPCYKLNEILIWWFITHPLRLHLVLTLKGHRFSTFKWLSLAKDRWSVPETCVWPYCSLNPI